MEVIKSVTGYKEEKRKMNKIIVISTIVWFSVLTDACYGVGQGANAAGTQTIVCEPMEASTLGEGEKRADFTPGVILQVLPRQPLSKGFIEFSTAVSNNSTNKIVLRADAFLDGMVYYLHSESDPKIMIPANCRLVTDGGGLPPRPYTISGWHIVTKLPGGTVTTNELPKTLLQCNKLFVLEKETVVIPPYSTLVVDFKMGTLEKITRTEKSVKTEILKIEEGNYTLSYFSMFLRPDKEDSSARYCMRFGFRKPVTITVFKDAGIKLK